jgi:hypothetical protein
MDQYGLPEKLIHRGRPHNRGFRNPKGLPRKTTFLARKEQLQRLDSIHNQGLRIAVGVFCICRTKNILCEAGMANLSSRRALKAATTAIRIAARLELSMKQALEDAETYDWYAIKPNHTKPFFIRAIDACASLGIELREVDVMVRRQQSS